MYVRRLVAKSRTDHTERTKGNMAQHIVVAGEQIMVVEVEEANLYEHVPARGMVGGISHAAVVNCAASAG